jgi:haloalkane dehalogenase
MSRDIPAGVESRFVEVRGEPMHYLEAGAGPPIVFLHGNPTSSYLWRGVLPRLAPRFRCIALDLIGMGKSSKPEIAYTLRDHASYVDGFIERLGLDRAIFVGHDWGVALSCLHLARFPERVRAVVLMEGRIRPVERWADLAQGESDFFRGLRSESGRGKVLEENVFVEQILPSGIARTLHDAEMAVYRAPYPTPRDREPLWRWVREVPIEGEPVDATVLVTEGLQALATSQIPKLLLHAQPGAVIGLAEVAWCRAHLPRLTAVDLGPGIHFLPEDHPDAIGAAISTWLDRNDNHPEADEKSAS